MEHLQEYKNQVIALGIDYVPRLVLALVTLVLGLWIVSKIVTASRAVMEKRGVDKTLVPFLASLSSWILKAVVFISVASMVGIETTSFIALLGAAGLAVGLALQGSLGNFAGGVLILIFRPYDVGDLIEAQGQIGVVKEIQIFTTTLLSPQNKRIIIPNGPMSNGTIVNFSAEGMLRVDMTIGIAYDSDIAEAKELLLQLLKSDERVLADPVPVVVVTELADSSINLAVRPHCRPEHYWGVYCDTLQAATQVLADAGISIPFPQRDVHLYQRAS